VPDKQIPYTFVYFIKGPDGNIKIGRTTNLRPRINGLAGKAELKDILLACIASIDYRLENDLHQRFKNLCVGYEWFKPGQELMDYIESIKGKADYHNLVYIDRTHLDFDLIEEDRAFLDEMINRDNTIIKRHPSTIVKCPHCGGDVKIPAEIDDAARKWMDRGKSQCQLMREKRTQNPQYGQKKRI